MKFEPKHKNCLNNLNKNSVHGQPILAKQNGRYFNGKNKEVTGSALADLITWGVLKPNGDALLPNMTQTYRLDLKSAVA